MAGQGDVAQVIGNQGTVVSVSSQDTVVSASSQETVVEAPVALEAAQPLHGAGGDQRGAVNAPRAMSPEEISASTELVTGWSAGQGAEECPICFEELRGEVRVLLCFHMGHAGCLADWLGQNGTCPVCRSSALDPAVGQGPVVSPRSRRPYPWEVAVQQGRRT